MDITLTTERIILRRFTPEDVELLVELDRDPEVMRYLTGGAPTPRGAIQRDILPGFIQSYARGPGFGVWAAHAKASGEFLGWFSFRPLGDDPADVALGYRLRRAAWGQGYATEGARALIRRGFADLGARRVSATTYQDNLASRRVMVKLGMRHVRSFRYTPEELQASDTTVQTGRDVWDGEDVEYEILRDPSANGPS